MTCIYVPVWEVLDFPGVALTASQSRNGLAAGRHTPLPPSWGQSCSLAAILDFPKGLEKPRVAGYGVFHAPSKSPLNHEGTNPMV